ncbi:hypothetical protein [Teichococcus wenyumeiae]|uniref:Uncharacterized protein n=1 Tax=Teichococcus wenyumeiae TaxID=2478470 RepID=A0A3A9JI70_9PROT|nr:hypothetical protein [Pseudoroseomonas wenyumeiae]RKK03354.1 hypothetical protein D6Z83_15035 [Pseudoroseomonas wenyumeiae]
MAGSLLRHDRGLRSGAVAHTGGDSAVRAAYIVFSGILLIWGTSLLLDRPDLGLGILFLAVAVAVSQTVGAPLFGAVLDGASAEIALSLFAAMACRAIFWRMEETNPPRQIKEPRGFRQKQ